MNKITILLVSILISTISIHAQTERYYFNTQEDTYFGGVKNLDTELVINYNKMELKLHFLEDANDDDIPIDKILEIRRPNKYLTVFVIDIFGKGMFPPTEVKLYKSPDTGQVRLTKGSKVYYHKK